MSPIEKFLSDTFEIVDVLKSPEKSFVALAYDKKNQHLCVIKQRPLNSLEIYRKLKELNNSHVPEIYRLIERDGTLIVIEEHIDGQTLDELMTYRPADINEDFAPEILKQLCYCLREIHSADIVHRDLKPSNIMVTKENVVKLIDFGIARTFKPDSRADTEILGTRGYAPPEQYGLFEAGQTDARSDIYSLGITMKILLGEDYRGRLLPILNRCTDLEPSRRYQSATAILCAIDDLDKPRTERTPRIIIYVLSFAAAIGAFVLHPTPLSDEPPPIPTEEPVEISVPNSDDKTEPSKQTTSFPQIVYTPPIATESIQTPQSIQTPAPVVEPAPKKNIPKPRESFDGVDCYLYINGRLTGTDGSHLVYIDDWRNWTPYKNGVAFPADWNAALHIVNNGTNDLINPVISVSVGGKNEFTFQKPTVKVGQSLNLDISLADKFVAPINGTGHLRIKITSAGRNDMYINRTFSLVK